jgi:hydroxymethylpyrimidine pyrophosphatase-like HAD family hydrolase
VLETYPIPVEVGLDVARRLRAALPDVHFAVEVVGGFAREDGYLARWDVGLAKEIGDVEVIYDEPALKLLVRHEAMGPDELLAAARAVAGDLVEMTHSSDGERGLLEISAAGVSKASALARFCAARGIDAADVVAFGDMPNDLPLLAWAGLAYAVSSGHPDVLAAVPRVVDPPEQHGVARELERLFSL